MPFLNYRATLNVTAVMQNFSPGMIVSDSGIFFKQTILYYR